MKTKLEYIACMLSLLTVFASCSKEDPKPVEESPFFSFFDQPAITLDTTPVATTPWEYGFVFNPLANGKITKLGVKMPATGQFHVTLWNLSGATPTILSEQNVTATAAHSPVFADITAVGVQKNATLGITVRANAFYRIQKQNATAFSFPLQIDNIRILSFNEEQNPASAAFPPTTNSNRVAPCVNVVFVAD